MTITCLENCLNYFSTLKGVVNSRNFDVKPGIFPIITIISVGLLNEFVFNTAEHKLTKLTIKNILCTCIYLKLW